MSLYDETVPVFQKMLSNLSNLLDLANASAEERGFDIDVLLTARLAPNQWTLTRQVQGATDMAKLTTARLAQTTAPKHEDGPATLEELKIRIADVSSFLEGLDPAAFEGAEDRMLSPNFLKGGTVAATEYTRGFALPNFYFHVTTAYAILRHNGVKLSKGDFIGKMDIHPPK